MQFHNHQQPRFITLGDRLVDIYGIVDILPFQVEAPNRGTTPVVCHKVNLISGESLRVLDEEDKKTIETLLVRQGVDVDAVREEVDKANHCNHSLA